MIRRFFSSSTSRSKFRLSQLKVIYEDNHLLVLNKPHGMLSQPGLSREQLINPFQKNDSMPEDLLSYAAHYIKLKYDKPGNVFVSLVNRLDRPVSGIIVCAKTSKAASRVASEFSARRTEKEYVAVVDGELRGHGSVEAGITSYDSYWKERGGIKYQRALDISTRSKEIVGKMDGELRYTAIQHHVMPEGDVKTLVGIKTSTGYKHQIRRQMAFLGHPITGDILYGNKNRQEKELLFPNQDKICLHANFLKIRHPVGARKPISFVASLSKDFFPWMEFDTSRKHYFDIEEANRAAEMREAMKDFSHI